MATPKVVTESETMGRLKALKTRTIQEANGAIRQIKQKCDSTVKKLDAAIAGKKAAEVAAVEVIEDLGA